MSELGGSSTTEQELNSFSELNSQKGREKTQQAAKSLSLRESSPSQSKNPSPPIPTRVPEECSRLYQDRYGIELQIDLRTAKKAKEYLKNGVSSDEFVAAYKEYLEDGQAYLVNARHPFALFLKQFEEWRWRVRRDEQNTKRQELEKEQTRKRIKEIEEWQKKKRAERVNPQTEKTLRNLYAAEELNNLKTSAKQVPPMPNLHTPPIEEETPDQKRERLAKRKEFLEDQAQVLLQQTRE